MSGIILAILFAAIYVILSYLIASKIMYVKLYKNPRCTSQIFFISLITIFLLPAYIYAYRKYSKQRDGEIDSLAALETAPNEMLINKYMELMTKYCEPQNTDKARAIWIIVNESSAITTEKKREFRNFLMTRGLNLVGNDKNVIDNYCSE